MTKTKVEKQRIKQGMEHNGRVCLSFREFGQRVGLTAATIRRMTKAGQLPVHVFNKRLARIPITALAFFQ